MGFESRRREQPVLATVSMTRMLLRVPKLLDDQEDLQCLHSKEGMAGVEDESRGREEQALGW